MVLEENGSIRRLNQAARRVFDFSSRPEGPDLASIWDPANPLPLESLLSQASDAGTMHVTLRVLDGGAAEFVAHLARVVRDNCPYLVLQLFKDSGAAFPELAYAPPSKEIPRRPVAASAADAGGLPFDLSNAGWAVFLVDAGWGIVRANPEARRLFGSKATREGAALMALCAPEDAGTLEKLLSGPRKEAATWLKFRLEQGTARPMCVQLCPADDSKRVLLQAFPEAPASHAPGPALALAVPTGTEEEEDFLLQDADWPSVLVRKTGEVMRANRAAVRAFGAAIERKDGNLAMIWSAQNPDSVQQFLSLPTRGEASALKFALKSGLPGVFAAHLSETAREDVALLQLLKAAVPVLEGVVPAKVEAPSPSAAPAVGAAVSAGVDAGLAHKQKLDCALQLARSVALDFNNALTSILGHTSLLLSKAENTHPWRNSLAEIEKSAAKAAEIANDLAAFSRQEKDTRVQVAGNLNTLLERTIEAFQSSLQKPIVVLRQLERKLYTASFDEAKMQQALIKVLENAAEAIKAEGKINVQTRNLDLSEPTHDRTAKLVAGSYVCVEISDTGAGIGPEAMPRIFEPFFSTKGARHRGLGLAWVYGIVTNHGGGVAVSSQPGAGTTVRLYLPAIRRIAREAPVSPTDLTGNQTLLFVDDEDLLLTMGQMILSSFGYTVLTANSGQKALEIFSASPKKIDLVITDLVMPNMSGRELGEQILKLKPGTRILWSSGYVRPADAQEQERYLQKPFTSQDLLRKVKQVLSE